MAFLPTFHWPSEKHSFGVATAALAAADTGNQSLVDGGAVTTGGVGAGIGVGEPDYVCSIGAGVAVSLASNSASSAARMVEIGSASLGGSLSGEQVDFLFTLDQGSAADRHGTSMGYRSSPRDHQSVEHW
ncbi:unnamed protein product [Protopolystoma xenopodis]|uniref:Uncharacterized protein n=1 Tax=Protopolystoma xenopodis TaxID=117903 RepID=A0A3S5A6Y5_9PLAT|nr:unnamed protein product [Protopolystoma xenopodis]